MNLSACRVCGCLLDFAPWGEGGTTPTFDYCPCCGIEFGVQDTTYESTKIYRNRWLRNGAKWEETGERPEGWNLAEQLDNVLPNDTSVRAALQIVEEARGNGR